MVWFGYNGANGGGWPGEGEGARPGAGLLSLVCLKWEPEPATSLLTGKEREGSWVFSSLTYVCHRALSSVSQWFNRLSVTQKVLYYFLKFL